MAAKALNLPIIDRIIYNFKHILFGAKRQLAFLEDLHVLINDGIPANRAVEMVTKVTTGVPHEVALTISRKIAEGQPLAEGMKEWFQPNVVELVRIGETGGALAQTLKSAINMLAQRGMAIGALVKAVTYPLFILGVACVLIVYLNNSVFEQFRLMKPEERWPASGQRLVWLYGFIKGWGWLALGAIFVIFFAFRWILKNYTGSLRPILDKYPPFNFYRRLVAARVLETIGLLVGNGVVFKSALRTLNYGANPYMRYHIDRMEILLGMGKSNIADVLDTGLITQDDLMRLRVMAEVKGFDHGLVRMGLKGAQEATDALAFLAKILGGVFLILDALFVIMITQGLFETAQSMGRQG